MIIIIILITIVIVSQVGDGKSFCRERQRKNQCLASHKGEKSVSKQETLYL